MILDELLSERAHLLRLAENAKNDIVSAPSGRLRIAHAKTTPNYYHRKDKGDRIGSYIKDCDRDIARALAQKEYAAEILKAAEQRIASVDKLIDDYRENRFSQISESYNPARRKLIMPYVLNDDEYVKKWLETPYISNPSYPENLIFETANGIMVRSKSEQIIAENLMRLGIPYKYEAPIYYGQGKAVYPDFTLLNVKQRKIFYYEHFGRMGEEKYLNDFFRKQKIYISIGVYTGKNLICTFEDQKHPFDFSSHRKMFEEMLL